MPHLCSIIAHIIFVENDSFVSLRRPTVRLSSGLRLHKSVVYSYERAEL